jgi:hypothetical protein
MTYGRTSVLEESIYSFINQKYEGVKEMIIVNDYPEQTLIYDHPEITIINLDYSFSTIGEKDNFTTSQCKYDTIAVWDDDDIALPNHLTNINKFFPGFDLLHWNNAAFINFQELESLTNVGNSGIVYTKQIWNDAGGYKLENTGHDMTFTQYIKHVMKCKVINAHPPDDEVSWMYLWGGRSYHMSGEGADIYNKESIIIRHQKYINELKNEKKIPIGDVYLNPKWNIDYSKLLHNYIHENNCGLRNA